MPEGPEIYTTCSDLNNLFEDVKTIQDIHIVGGRYVKHGEPDNWDDLINLLPLTVTGVYCKGKMVWFEFEKTDIVLVSRFGMSGYYGCRAEDEESPKHTAVEFELLDTRVLYYNDVRRFGTFKILLDGIESELDRLGPCFLPPPIPHPLIEKLEKEDFTDLIISRRGKLARELMKQEVVSGVGNYILSECLYDTELNPLIECKDLTQEQAENLYDNIVNIMERSVKFKGVSIRDYRPLEQGENGDCGGSAQYHLKVYKQKEDPKGNEVQIIKKGPHGRAIHWVPAVQS